MKPELEKVNELYTENIQKHAISSKGSNFNS
jgi:hypothetical protein